MVWEFLVELIKEWVLKYYLYVKKDRYIIFIIFKRIGGIWEIKVFDCFLKLVQCYLNIVLQCFYMLLEYVIGFVVGRSVIDNVWFYM